MLDGFIAVAATQSKHICYLQSSSHLAPSQVASDSAATLPWLPSLYADIAPTSPSDAAADLSGSSAGQLVAGAPDTTTIAAAGDGEAPPELPPDPVVGTGTGLLPVHTSTPKPPGSSWTEVRHGRKGDPAAERVPPVELSNRFSFLMDEAPVHPGDSPAVPAPTAHPAAATPPPPAAGGSTPAASAVSPQAAAGVTSPATTAVSSSPTADVSSPPTADVSSPPATAPPPLPAPSASWTARHSTMGNSCHRMLQKAVIRRS
ncbi:hypothetical protein ABVT39_004812 [Epinephelus coioides]